MRILVYGAGVIGCQLAHELNKSKKNEVTILARGAWAQTLREKGLQIRHYIQLNTTHDIIPVIETLEQDDVYDLIFVVMQQGQVTGVLPALAKNSSKYLVFVGNNLEAPEVEDVITKKCSVKREIAFGFQGSGGRREQDRVVSVHINCGMTVGALEGELSREFKKRLREAFTGTGYRLKKETHMDAWLKCHAAFILPACYLCYQWDGALPKITKNERYKMMDAIDEAYVMLHALGYPIRPDGQREFLINNRTKCYWIFTLLLKTPIGRLAVSDHAMHAIEEIKTIDQSFEYLRMQAAVPMRVWNKLREHSNIERLTGK